MTAPYVHLNFGNDGESSLPRLRGFLVSALKPLREEFARRLKELRKDFPSHRLPCETCAFRSGTDDHQGFEMTIASFITALHAGELFLCHHNMRRDRTGQWRPPTRRVRGKKVIDWRRAEYCTAWMVLTSTTPEPFDVHTVVPEIVCDGLASVSHS